MVKSFLKKMCKDFAIFTDYFSGWIERSLYVCVCMAERYLSNQMTFDLDIWHDSSP